MFRWDNVPPWDRPAGILFLLLAVALMFLIPGKAKSGWGAGGCPPVGGPRFAPPPVLQRPAQGDTISEWEWKGFPDGDEYALYRRGLQVGGWKASSNVYRPFNPYTRLWGEPCPPPCPPPALAKATGAKSCDCCPDCDCGADCKCRCGGEKCCGNCWCCIEAGVRGPAEAGKVQNFGVQTEKLDHRPTYRINEKSVCREDAWRAIASGSVPDDRAKLRLTVIGSEPERKQVLADLDSAPLSEFKDKLLVQSYAPDHWQVKDAGFVTAGHPTIYTQAPDGKVLHRQDDYAGGAQALATAIRKADANYKPQFDPDLRKDTPAPGPDGKPCGGISCLWKWLVVAAGLLVVWLWKGAK